MSVLGSLIVVVVVLLAASMLWTRRLAAGAERAVPQAGKILKVRGGAIHYTDEGSRESQPVVLIHGLAGSMHNLTYGLTSELASDFRVITIDRPGTGYSSRDDDDLAALPQQAAMIWEFLDRLGVEKPVLVGHSLGGALSLAMAMQRKDKTGSVALISPLTATTPEPPAVFKPLAIGSKLIRRVIGHTVAVPVAKMTSATVIREVFAPEPAPADFLVRGGGILGLRPGSFIAASADLYGVSQSLPAQAARYKAELDVPGGVLYGTDDRLLSPDLHGRSMEAYGLFYECLPGRGHMIPVTEPKACADFVRRVAGLAR